MSFVYTKSSFLLLFITLFLATIPFTSSSSITSYDIRELKRNDDCFKIEASPWYISQIRSGQSNTTICSGTYLLGGYGVLGTSSSQSNVYIQRSYSNLPIPHAVVYFSFTFWAIDSWNAGPDSFNIKLDGTTLTGWSNFDSNNFPAKKCGNNNSKDLPGVRVFGSMSHTVATLTFQMISKLDQDSTNESFGIRDLIILIGKNTIGTPASICGLATIAVGNGEQCACPEGQYHAGTGCTVCDNSCASCFGSSNAECYACKTGYSFDGNNCFACATGCAACNTTTCVDCQTGYLMVHNTTCVSPASCISPLVQTGCGSFCDTPCSDPTMYAYWNGTCNATCNAPLQKNDALLGYYKVCIYPCSSTQYLYWNGSCQPNCLSPLQAGNQGGKLYCYFPCNATSPVLYWNGTCNTSCPSPLSTVTQYSQTFCKFPCTGSQFLYWNTTCSSVCDFPLLQRLEGGKWFCDYPCLATKFLYWNGSCLGTCDAPLTPITDASGKQYCNYTCATSQFLDWNRTCQASCPSPLSTRVEGGRQFCDYPCLTTQFRYWNNTCGGSCPPPLSTRIQSLRNFCDFPCTIQTQYLYENGTCKATCPTPLVAKLQGGKKFCDYPCSATQYLYWNGTCLGTCDFPLYSTNYSGELYCNYPCLSNQFLYWDGTCNTTCYPPLQQVLQGGRRFCDYKCSSSQFLYWNKTCLPSCNTPLVQTTFAGKQLCKYPCATGEFLYQNGSCIDECLMPFEPREEANKDYCDPICPTNYYFLSNGSCIASCDAPMHFQTNSTGTFCMLPCPDPSYYYDEDLKQCTTSCNKSSLFYDGLYYICFEADYGPVRLVKQLHYIRFLEINLPHRLQGINEMKGTNVLSLRGAQDMFPMLREWLTVLPLPSIFKQRNLNSMFFANFIDELTILAGILILAVLFFILEKAFQCMKMLTPQTVFERLGVLVRWNLPLMILAVNSGDIIFYTTLEFRTYDPDYSGALLSLGICIAFLIAVIAMFVLTMVLVYEAQVVKEEMLKTKSYVNYSKFVIRWESFQVLFRGYKDTTWLDQAFLVIYCTRLVSPMLISAFLYDLPLLQAILYLAINLAMLIYVLWRRPIRKRIDNINLCLIEGVMLAINISALMLVVYDLTESDQEKVHAFLGDVIIYGNDCISFIAMTFLIAKLVLNVQLALSFRREKSAHEKLIWAQLLFIPLQQGCFGFEQVQIQPFSGDNNVKKKIAIEDVPLPDILRSTVAKKFHANNLELDERADTLDVVNLSGNTTPAPIKKRMNQNQQSFPRHQIDSEYDDVSPTLENLKEIVSTKRTHNIRQIVPIGEAPTIKRGLSDDIQPVDVAYENGSEISATSKMWRNDEVSQFLGMHPSPGKNERGYGDHDVSIPLDLGPEMHSDNEGGQSKGNEGKKGGESGSDNNAMMNRINSMDKPRERLLNLLKEELPFQE